MSKKISILVSSIITLYSISIDGNCNKYKDDQININVNDSIGTESNINNTTPSQNVLNITPPGAPNNTNSFLMEHGGDPMMGDEFLSTSIIQTSLVQLSKNTHETTINLLTRVVDEFTNKNNYTITQIKSTIENLNNIYDSIHENDNNNVIVEKFMKYLNKLEELNNRILNNKSLSKDKQQFIKSNQVLNIISNSKLALDNINEIDENQRILGNSILSF